MFLNGSGLEGLGGVTPPDFLQGLPPFHRGFQNCEGEMMCNSSRKEYEPTYSVTKNSRRIGSVGKMIRRGRRNRMILWFQSECDGHLIATWER